MRRVLAAKIRLGLFENPYVDEDRARTVLADPAHRDEARVAAERSAVLLRNEGDLLPLDAAALGSVAVVGPLADSKRDTLGPWCFDFDLDETVTVLEGLRRRLGDSTEVRYAPGIRPAQRVFPSMFDMFPGNTPPDPEGFDDEAELQRAVELARDSDLAVVVLGEWQQMIGEAASRSSLELPGRQLELLQAVVETGTPVVLLVMNGRPLDLRWAVEHVPAILDIWYPGTQGGAAVANLLLGDVSPGGKLPFTWPRTVGQVPITYAHTMSHEPENRAKRYWDEESTPLFPFGYGLSYARFAYADLSVDRSELPAGESLTVSVTVRNTGDQDGAEVVQLYLHQRHGTAARPVRELKGFQRVHLAAGAEQTVTFTLGSAELRYWNAAVRDFVIDLSIFDVWVGADSTAELSTTFHHLHADLIAGRNDDQGAPVGNALGIWSSRVGQADGLRLAHPRRQDQGRGDQHHVLDHELADRGQQQRVAVLEGQLGLHHQHQEGAAEVGDEDRADHGDRPAQQQAEAQGHLDRAEHRDEPGRVDERQGAGDQLADGRHVGDLEGAEPDEHQAERDAQQGGRHPAQYRDDALLHAAVQRDPPTGQSERLLGENGHDHPSVVVGSSRLAAQFEG